MLTTLRKISVAFLALVMLVIAQTVQGQIGQPGQPNSRGSEPVNITCETDDISVVDGTTITIVQLRSGANYTATVIGLDDFDPVMITTSSTGRTTACNDNSEAAAEYSATLPGAGTVSGNSTSAQVTFHQTIDNLEDVHINIGGKDGMSGEFLLIIQGMRVTSSEGTGDPFKVILSEGLFASGVPITAYMFAIENELDATIWTIDDEFVDYIMDGDEYIYCDDAGAEDICYGDNSYLNTSRILDGSNTVVGNLTDSMVSIDPSKSPFSDMESVHFVMTSYDQASTGDYILVFQMGIE